ncbi:MAG: acyl-CoA thioesterase [Rhodanobacteraceae bacterium]|nr:acyl-CoA thioesterase [Rhodanobacteraceae bacterium]MBK7043698.1 acyl-CoA thioesterase [Rhodanobacteraceae bacterium]MBP9154824.1 acyl-CoA thioesterase [Xanthomonadales bacterium]HQW80784.1 acyl-CoA thioesterase [Pseudomonadota bacterium]
MSGSQRDVTFRFLAEPTDVNFGGKVHGGAVMKWIDQAGYACAAGWAGRYCVTVYVGGIQFERPIQVGQIVEVHAQIVHTGSTSMHVAVDVAARDATADGAERTTHCLMVFVAIDESRQPVAVPAYTPQNDEERELSSYAQRMMLMRRQVEAERRSFLARFRSATTSPQQ